MTKVWYTKVIEVKKGDIVMRATFKGRKKSMKYKPNRDYILAITYHNGHLWAVDINGVGKPVPYESIKAFLDNWEILRRVHGNYEKVLLDAQAERTRMEGRT